MSDYWICSDNIDGKENSYINALCDALKKKGHNATNGGVGPNTVQSHGLSSSASGQIGVFIVGGSDAGMYVDFRDGLKNGYYHYKEMWAVFASNTATTDKWITCNGLANTPLVRAWDDNYSGSSIESVGQTAKAYFEANKQYIHYACGKMGCSFDDVIQNFLQGGGMDSDDEKEGSSASTIKDALKQLLAAWDGEVECRVVNEYVYVNKIQDPQERHHYYLTEGTNIFTDSVTITDYNPDTPNFLTVHWQGGEDIVYRDEKLIARFGEKPLELDAVKKVTTTEEKPVSSTSTSTTDSDIETTTDTSTGTSDTSTTSTNETETEIVTKTEEVPVETLEEAETFARVEWAKIKRDNGHKLECKVTGSEKWRNGEWAKVYMPSFDLDDFMYIIQLSQSEDSNGDWTANLTLLDYPPSFGTDTGENTDEEEEEETTDEETTEEVDGASE